MDHGLLPSIGRRLGSGEPIRYLPVSLCLRMVHESSELALYDGSASSRHLPSLGLKEWVEVVFRVGPDAEPVSFEVAEVWAGGRSVSVGN